MKNSQQRRNTSVDAMRFFFMIMICLWHLGITPWLTHGYIAVEFYFILSGFFLYRSFVSHPEDGTLVFTLKKVKRFFPPYFLSIVALMAIDRKQYFYLNDCSSEGILQKYFTHIPEFFMLQDMGITHVLPINGPTWFVSVLIVGGGILHSFLKVDTPKTIGIYLPLICLMGFNLLLPQGSFEWDKGKSIPLLGHGFLRGITEMSVGILVSYVFYNHYETINRFKNFFNYGSIVSLICFGLMATADGHHEYLAIIGTPIIIGACLQEGSFLQKLFHHKVWNFLGGLTMEMLFIHLLITSLYFIFSDWFKEWNVGVIVLAYLIIVVISAYLLRIISMKLSNSFNMFN